MPVVRVKRGNHFRREEGKIIQYNVGDRIEVTDREYKNFIDKLELVGESAPEPSEDDDTGGNGGQGGGADDEFNLEEATKKELLAKAEEIGLEFKKDWSKRRLRDVIEEALEETGEE